jgi:molecular chaperone HtpG
MTHNDLINCLGTIAKSGTEEFVKNMLSSESNKSNLIGQFGVGFYSAFLISDRVQVYSKHPESDKVLLWESDAVSGYSISEVEDETLKRGSRMVLHVKPDQLEYLEDSKITEIVKKHSEFITYPIFLLKKTKVKKPVERKSLPEGTEQPSSESLPEGTEQPPSESLPEGTEQPPSESFPEGTEQPPSESLQEKTDTGDVVIDSDSDLESDNEETKKDKEPEQETEEVIEIVYQKLNSESIWMKNPTEVTEEEYQRFYKSISSDYDDHQKVKHFKAEGNLEFSFVHSDTDTYFGTKSSLDCFSSTWYSRKRRLTRSLLNLRSWFCNGCEGITELKITSSNFAKSPFFFFPVFKSSAKRHTSVPEPIAFP